MSIDQEIQHNGSQKIDPASVKNQSLVRWLSAGLIVVGVALMAAGGLKAYLNVAVVPEPPPPVGLVEPTAPPSLEDNPLLVFAEDDSSQLAPGDATLTLLRTPDQSGSVMEPSLSQPAQRSEREVPPGLPSMAAAAPDAPPPATHPPTRIVAPSIRLDSKVVPVGWKQVAEAGEVVTVWEVAEYAAGWHKNSALPGGGGNIVLSGHHNMKGEVFRYIVGLDLGDTITLYADDRSYTYTVESRFVVRDKGVSEEQRRENARWIGPFPDERLTLITCWPYTNNTHRVIVIAKPTD